MSYSLETALEAILFWKGEPVSLKKLSDFLACTEKDIQGALPRLKESLKGRGITIIEHDSHIALTTAPEVSELIQSITKDELSKDLGKAGLETLSIILYQGPLSRADIDYIRGVSSQFIIRNLLIRGLIERVDNEKDARSFLYKPSLELLSHLGISRIQDLPEFEHIRQDIENFKNNSTHADQA